jgi:K+-transporting ATPase ATPase A chain
MTSELIGFALLFGTAVGLAVLTGRYLSRVFQNEPSLLDGLAPLERLLFRLIGVDPARPMPWSQYLGAVAVTSVVWLVLAVALLMTQTQIPLWNQGGIPSMDWTLALNTAVSFLTSTNLQHYSGESGATYFSQLAVLMFLQFMSAATSLAVGVALVRSLRARSGTSPGNFYGDLVRSLTRLLLPLSLLVSVGLVFAGVPMTFAPYDTIQTLQGDLVSVARGPVAAMLPIKHLGSNGGGFFGTNTAHPFENPGMATYCLHLITVFLLPMAFVCFVGYYLNRRKLGVIIFTLMTGCWLMLTIPIMQQEWAGNPSISALGIDQSSGSLEGKEMRFGTLASAFWCGVNIVIPAGTLTSMHDSYTPLSGLFMLLGMQIDAFYGGVGTGFMYLFLYIIIAIFIGSLMIGRTPELLGKKVGQTEIQLAVGVIVAQPLIYLGLTAVAVLTVSQATDGGVALGWLGNRTAGSNGYHGFTTMLYEYVSSVAGNGSGFEGLGDNTPFWNLTTALAMLLGRFIPIVGTLLIGAQLYQKPYVPSSSGTLPTESYTFGVLLFIVIVSIGALCFFPALAIGPIAEYLTQPR